MKCRVGFYVEVEVESYIFEAGVVAEHACGFPGDWQPPHEPIRVSGTLNGKVVEGDLIRSRVLSVAPAHFDEIPPRHPGAGVLQPGAGGDAE